MQALDNVKIICYDRKIYVPQSMCRCVLYWYHFYLNHSSDSRIAKKIREVCCWKDLVLQADLFTKTCNTCQQFKNRKTIYGHMPTKNIAELKPWDSMHVDLIGPYRKSIRQQQPGGAVISKNYSMTWMNMIEPDTGWFVIIEIPTFNLDEVTSGND